MKETQIKPDPEELQSKESYPLLEAARKVLLAGIGAISLAQEEIEDFINKLVERGEIAEKDGKKLIQELQVKRNRGAEKAEEELHKRVNLVLDRMNVASKSDIDELNNKIAVLTMKLEESKKS